MPTVLIVPVTMREVEAPYVDVLQRAGFEVRYPKNQRLASGRLPEDEAVAELSVADATIASVEWYSPPILDRLPQLRVVARAGVGYDSVDIPAATARGIAVTITPTANTTGSMLRKRRVIIHILSWEFTTWSPEALQ